MLFVDGFASNDKMQRFKHHTEQQVYHTSKDLQQSPYTGKDSQQVGIVFILDGKTEYTNCMIQTVNDPTLSQKNITDSMISSFPSMHPPRICCHLFYRPESRESDQYPYLTKTSEDSTEKKSKMFGSVRKSLHRSRQYIEVVMIITIQR